MSDLRIIDADGHVREDINAIAEYLERCEPESVSPYDATGQGRRSVHVDSKRSNEYFRQRTAVFTPANLLAA